MKQSVLPYKAYWPKSVADHRVFFALWPDDAMRQRIHAGIPRDVARVPKEKWHITLRFLGNCPASGLECLVQDAKELSLPVFTLHLDRLGYWGRPRITWLSTSQVPEALGTLLDHIDLIIARCGLPSAKENRAFFPHLTLARRIKPAKKYRDCQLEETLDWPVREFSLIESRQREGRINYAELCRWRLQN